MVTAKKNKNKKKRHLGCLAHAMIGAFYSVAVNRRQVNLNIYIYKIYVPGMSTYYVRVRGKGRQEPAA